MVSCIWLQVGIASIIGKTFVMTALFISDAYQDTDIIYSWSENMVGEFDDVRNAIFDIPSFRVEEVVLKEGTNNYSIGLLFFCIEQFLRALISIFIEIKKTNAFSECSGSPQKVYIFY